MDANGFLATGHLALWILVAGLFLPRLTLFVAWLATAYPPNPLPDLLNFALQLFFPRFLIAFYIYTDIGMNNIWFWAYIAMGIFGLFGETGYARRRIVRRRTTVSRDGATTTTVEEEEVQFGAKLWKLGFDPKIDYSFGVKINWRNYSTQKPDPYWRGALIAARILRKRESGKRLSPRDRRVARELFEDEGISNRLIDQAVACLKAPYKF